MSHHTHCQLFSAWSVTSPAPCPLAINLFNAFVRLLIIDAQRENSALNEPAAQNLTLEGIPEVQGSWAKVYLMRPPMHHALCPLVLLSLLVAVVAAADGSKVIELDAILPPHETTVEDEYLCTAIELPDRPMKLIGVESLSEQNTVHHMLMFGCKEPAQSVPVWPCRMEPACGPGGEHVMYGWGKNAPPVHLPDGSGFSVGPGTGTRSVVLQVHYLKLRPHNDSSGVRVRLTSDPVPYSAGLVAYAAGFSVPPRKASTLVPNQCCYSGLEPLHGFAFRVHTHSLGRSVYLDQTPPSQGKQVQRAKRVLEQDPQLPQGFYPAEPLVTILPGDKLQATCDFNSSLMDAAVSAGHTSKEEMCNLYLMLYGELPFFMWCVDSREWVQVDGAGGVPAEAQLVPETQVWAPPAKIPAAAEPAMDQAAEGRPAEAPIGQVAGVAGSADGTVWAFFRGTRTWTAHTFDPATHKINKADPIRSPLVAQLSRDNGTVLRSWGAGVFYMPHMISQDYEGNLWVVDAGLHQALKFSPAGEQLLALGKRLKPGSDEGTFCMPTHAITARDGTVYVGDGYCNGRVVQFSPNGTFQSEFTLPQEGDGAPQPLPHSLALDECKRRLYVADREVGQVLAFDLDSGDVLGRWGLKAKYGLPYAIRIGPYGTLLALAWDRNASGKTNIVALGDNFGDVAGSWVAEGVLAPHDLSLVPAPLAVSGAGERLLSIVVAETAESDSKMRKYVLRGAHHTHTEHAPAESVQQGELPAGLGASHASHGTKLKPAGSGGSAAAAVEDAGAGQNDSRAARMHAKEEHVEAVPEEKANEIAAGETTQTAADGSGGDATPVQPLQRQEQPVQQQPAPVQPAAVQPEVQGTKQATDASVENVQSVEPPLDVAPEHRRYAASTLLGVAIGVAALGVVGFLFVRAASWQRTVARGYRQPAHAA